MAAQQQTITTNTNSNKKNGLSPKSLFSLIGVLVLMLGVVAGVLLIGQKQFFQSKAGVRNEGYLNNPTGDCSSLEIHPDAKAACSSFCTNSGCTLPAIPTGVCEIRRYHTDDKGDEVVNDFQTGFTNSAGGNLSFIDSCGAEQIDVGCYTDDLFRDEVYNDGFKTVAYAWKRYTESCGQQSQPPASDATTTTTAANATSTPLINDTGQCSDWCTSPGDCANAGGTVVSRNCTFANCSGDLVACLVDTNTGGGGDTPPAPAPTAPPGKACGESCTNDSDCLSATTGVATACRGGQCVNLGCYDSGGQTTYGTRCDCVLAHECGAPCGGTIGLCKPGYSCTYRAQNKCSTKNLGVCVPKGTNTSTNRGPMTNVPLYEGAAFERKQCGAGTSDSKNSFIYHPSFPNHVFTTEEVMEYICNPGVAVIPSPSPSPAPNISAQCLEVKVYDTNGDRLTQEGLKALQPGDTIVVSVRGNSTLGNIDKARFRINSAANQETSQIKSGTNDEYYIQYTIPQGATGLQIDAEVHHETIGWL